jgi:hypothetical protein
MATCRAPQEDTKREVRRPVFAVVISDVSCDRSLEQFSPQQLDRNGAMLWFYYRKPAAESKVQS